MLINATLNNTADGTRKQQTKYEDMLEKYETRIRGYDIKLTQEEQ